MSRFKVTREEHERAKQRADAEIIGRTYASSEERRDEWIPAYLRALGGEIEEPEPELPPMPLNWREHCLALADAHTSDENVWKNRSAHRAAEYAARSAYEDGFRAAALSALRPKGLAVERVMEIVRSSHVKWAGGDIGSKFFPVLEAALREEADRG